MHVNKLLAKRAPTQAAATKLLGCNVEIVIRPKAGRRHAGQVTVSLA
jgi:hypothetical protein